MRSPHVPTRKVQKVDTTALTPTIHETMAGSGAILSYTKLLNQEFSIFQQIWPAIPNTQIKIQFLRLMLFISRLLFCNWLVYGSFIHHNIKTRGQVVFLQEKFQKDPVKALEDVLGVDLPDDVINQVIAGVKTKLTADKAAGAVDAIKKLF